MARYYAAAAIDGIAPRSLHMTLVFIGAKAAPWLKIDEDLSTIPLPFEISFDKVIHVGENADIEAVQVSCTDPAVDKAIRAVHKLHVEECHISQSNILLHVTSKGHADALLAAKTYKVSKIYVKVAGDSSGVPILAITV